MSMNKGMYDWCNMTEEEFITERDKEIKGETEEESEEMLED